MAIDMILILCAALSTVIAIGLARTLIFARMRREGVEILDSERHRKPEHGRICRLGGLAIFGGVTGGIVLFAAMGGAGELQAWIPALACSALMFGVGFIDDCQSLGAKGKLTFQFGVACIGYVLGLRVELLTAFGGHSIELPSWFAFLATITWLVTIPNIINLIDGIDGLAGGLGILACTTLAIVSLAAGQTTAGSLSLLFAAALIGFLIFNFPPAKIYMGDGGAYLIGGFLSTISLQSSQKGSVAAIFLVIMIALGLPILDTTLAILRRGLRGLPLFRGDARHVHHRLLARGYSKRVVVSVLYGVCLTLCTAGLVVFWTQGLALPIVLALLFVGGIALGRSLGIKPSWPALRRQVTEAARSRTQIRRSHRMGEYLLEEIQHCASAQDFWTLFETSAERLGFIAENKHHGTDTTAVAVHVKTEGNPLLTLSYPQRLKGAKNWWGLADCLYPAYTAGVHRWGLPEPPAVRGFTLGSGVEDEKIVALHA